jgi:zinc transporter ZupT
MKNISEWIGRFFYGLISLSLAAISLTMMGVALWGIWVSGHERALLVTALLNAIGLIVIGMAVFDVSKFLLEEEVFSSSSTKSPEKQRGALLKFFIIIAIAVSLEALVFIFDAGSKDITTLIYPTFLLIAAVLVVVGLGVYQRLTQDEVK